MKKDNIDYKALCEKMAKLSNSEIVEGYDSFGRFIAFVQLRPKNERSKYLGDYKTIAQSPHSRIDWNNEIDMYKDFIMECRVKKLNNLKNSRFWMLRAFFGNMRLFYNSIPELQMKLDLFGVNSMRH